MGVKTFLRASDMPSLRLTTRRPLCRRDDGRDTPQVTEEEEEEEEIRERRKKMLERKNRREGEME